MVKTALLKGGDGAAVEDIIQDALDLLEKVRADPQGTQAPAAAPSTDHDPCATCAALKGQIRGLCEAWEVPLTDRWRALLDGMGHEGLHIVIFNLREDRVLWPEGEPVPQMQRPPQFYGEIFQAAQAFGAERGPRLRAFEQGAMPSDTELVQQVRQRVPGMLPEVCSPDLLARLQMAFCSGALRPDAPSPPSQD